MKKMIVFMMILLTVIMIGGCAQVWFGTKKAPELKIQNLRIWQDTPAWNLAVAVNNQDTMKIKSIVEEKPELLNYQEPRFGSTLLFWAIGVEKYESAEALLKAGADPNIISTYEGGTALFRAAGYSFIDTQAKKDSRFVNLLLSYGADPNITFVGNEHDNSTQIGTSPLMNSIHSGIEKTKLLVEAGADINHKSEWDSTAAVVSLMMGGANADNKEAIEYAYFLIVEKKAKVNEPYLRGRPCGDDEDPYDKFYPVDLLRRWTPKLDSESYNMKMKIVEEFARQGVDYWSTQIPKYTLEHIKKLYPDTWQEYIKSY